MNFHETVMGHRFFEGTVPKLVNSLTSIAESLAVIAKDGVKLKNAEQKKETTKETEPDRQRVVVPLANGYKLVCENGVDPSYPRELYVGVEDKNGAWIQDLTIVKQNYSYGEEGQVEYDDEKFDVLVFGREDEEDYTESFTVGLND